MIDLIDSRVKQTLAETSNDTTDLSSIQKQLRVLSRQIADIKIDPSIDKLIEVADQLLVENNSLKKYIGQIETQLCKLQEGSDTERQILDLAQELKRTDQTLSAQISDIDLSVKDSIKILANKLQRL